MKKQNKELERSLFAKEEFMMRFSAEGPFYDLVAGFTGIKKGEKILDVGCGSGVYSIWMAKLGGKVVGIDVSKQAIDFANRWANEEKIDFKGIVGDAENLPFKKNTYDLLFYGAILHHFPDFSKAIFEGSRVLKRNGKLVLVEPNGYNPILRLSRIFARFLPDNLNDEIHATRNETLHSPRAYEDRLQKSGFKIIKKSFAKKKPIHKKTITKNWLLRLANRAKRIGIYVLSFGPKFLGSEYFILLAEKND